jgi:hypothetical protein
LGESEGRSAKVSLEKHRKNDALGRTRRLELESGLRTLVAGLDTVGESVRESVDDVSESSGEGGNDTLSRTDDGRTELVEETTLAEVVLSGCRTRKRRRSRLGSG